MSERTSDRRTPRRCHRTGSAADITRPHRRPRAVRIPGHHRRQQRGPLLRPLLGRSLQTLATNLPDGDVPERTEEVDYGMVVADGMGGMPPGRSRAGWRSPRSSSLALETPDWIFGRRGPRREIERRGRRASSATWRRCSSSRPARPGTRGHGDDADHGPEPRPRPAHRPRRRLAGLPAPRRRAAPPDPRPHLCAGAGRRRRSPPGTSPARTIATC